MNEYSRSHANRGQPFEEFLKKEMRYLAVRTVSITQQSRKANEANDMNVKSDGNLRDMKLWDLGM